MIWLVAIGLFFIPALQTIEKTLRPKQNDIKQSQYSYNIMSLRLRAFSGFLSFASSLHGFNLLGPSNAYICPYMNAVLQWRHNGRDGVSNHQPHHYWLVTGELISW